MDVMEPEEVDIINDLIDGPTGEPLPEAEAEPEPEPEAAPEAGPEPEEEPTAPEGEPEPAEPPKRTYKYRGREYTLDEMVKLGILEDVLTSAEQLPHLQKKYLEVLEKARAADAAKPQPGPTEAQPQPAAPSPEVVVAQCEPLVRTLVDQGYVEEDFVQAYPRYAAAQAYAYQELQQVKVLLAQVLDYLSREHMARMGQTVRGQLESIFDQLAQQGGYFSGLADRAARDAFVKYLADLNIEAGKISPDLVAREWVAFNYENIVKPQQSGQSDREQEQRKRAVGEGKGAPRTKPPAEVDFDQQLMLDLIKTE